MFQDFIRTSQPLDVRFYLYILYISTCLILKLMACHMYVHTKFRCTYETSDVHTKLQTDVHMKFICI